MVLCSGSAIAASIPGCIGWAVGRVAPRSAAAIFRVIPETDSPFRYPAGSPGPANEFHAKSHLASAHALSAHSLGRLAGAPAQESLNGVIAGYSTRICERPCASGLVQARGWSDPARKAPVLPTVGADSTPLAAAVLTIARPRGTVCTVPELLQCLEGRVAAIVRHGSRSFDSTLLRSRRGAGNARPTLFHVWG